MFGRTTTCSTTLILLWGGYAGIVALLSLVAAVAGLPEAVVWLMALGLGFAVVAATWEA